MRLALAFTLALYSAGLGKAAEAEPGAGPRIIRSAPDLLNLTPAELKQHLPVELHGTVILCDPPFNLLFVHDGKASVYVQLPGGADLQSGQVVEVQGIGMAGQFAPYIAVPKIKVVGTGPLPEPVRADYPSLAIGAQDAQWVEVGGIVEGARISSGRLCLEVTSGLVHFHAWANRSGPEDLTRFLHRQVNLRGILAVKLNAAKQLAGFQVFMNSAQDVAVVDAAAEPKELPLCSVRDLLGYRARLLYGRKVRVRGQVAAAWSAKVFLLQDKTGTVEIEQAEGDLVAPGSEVEVQGCLAFRPCCPRIEGGAVQCIGPGSLPPAVRVSGEAAWAVSNQNAVVELDAVMLARTVQPPDQVALYLRADGRDFVASLWAPKAGDEVADLAPGSRVRIAGVCRLELSEAGKAAADCPWCDGACRIGAQTSVRDLVLKLRMRSSRDLQVLGAPARDWTPWGVAAGVLVLAGGGLLLLQRCHLARLDRAQALQAGLEVKVLEHERQLLRSFEERERIGRDLHDDIIQSMFAVGLGLEDVRANCLRQAPDQADKRLGVAVESLNQIMRNVRAFIGGLEPKILDGREFKAALTSLALTAGESAVQIAIEVDPVAAGVLTSNEATQLLRIAKEAMSNSLRHANAARMVVALKREAQALVLEIADDGAGFDTEGEARQGQGLKNLASRAAAISARLEVISARGKGCRVLVHLPQR